MSDRWQAAPACRQAGCYMIAYQGTGGARFLLKDFILCA